MAREDLAIHSEVDFAANEEGLQLIAEIERLQNYVLDELDSLNERIRTVFRTFGYKESAEEDAMEESTAAD